MARVCDALDEGWRSMDLVAEMLHAHLDAAHADAFAVTRVRPAMRRRARRWSAGAGAAFTADRALHRFWDYPRAVRALARDFDLFHIVDHSYAHLVHALPADRVVVTCHDLDAFRSVLEPAAEPRSLAFRVMTRRILAGLRKAARVTCDSQATRDALLHHGVVPGDRTVVIANGVHPAFTPEPDVAADAEAAALLGPPDPARVELLHVGTTAPRKRLDVLLRVFAAVRRRHPAARLVRAGGGLDGPQHALARALGIAEAITCVPAVAAPTLAAVYRRAALVLQPSEREGFGLPVIEALAAGTPVLASDLPVLREVGGDAVTYRAVGDVDGWVEAVLAHLDERAAQPEPWARRRARAVGRAAAFTWTRYARDVAAVYREVLMTTQPAAVAR